MSNPLGINSQRITHLGSYELTLNWRWLLSPSYISFFRRGYVFRSHQLGNRQTGTISGTNSGTTSCHLRLGIPLFREVEFYQSLIGRVDGHSLQLKFWNHLLQPNTTLHLSGRVCFADTGRQTVGQTDRWCCNS